MGGGGQELAFHLVDGGFVGDIAQVQNLRQGAGSAAAQAQLQHALALLVQLDQRALVGHVACQLRAQRGHAQKRRAGGAAPCQPDRKVVFIQTFQGLFAHAGHSPESRADVVDTFFGIKRDKAVRAQVENRVELRVALFNQALCALACAHFRANLSEVARQRRGQRQHQQAHHGRLQPQGFFCDIVVGEH